MNNTPVFTVPPGHYFMMGDNRDNSSDSRDPNSGVGYVPAENLVGRAVFIFYSTDGYSPLVGSLELAVHHPLRPAVLGDPLGARTRHGG